MCGTVLVDLFHDSYQKEIFIKFKGEQLVPQSLQSKIDDKCVDLEPNDSLELEAIDALAFNNFEENEALIRKPSGRFSVYSDVMSVRSFQRGTHKFSYKSPVKERGGFGVVQEEGTNLSSLKNDTTDPEIPQRNIFSSDTNDFS